MIEKLRKIFNKYQCPFCFHYTNQFDPLGINNNAILKHQIIGAGKRNAKCIKCKSTDRERLVYVYLKYFTNIFKEPKNYKVLHIAPEKNLFEIFIASKFNEYVCGDLFTEGYSYPDYIQKIDLLGIPYKDDYFDLIICNHVLEHIENDEKAIKEIYRVLKHSGKAILQVPISKLIKKTYKDASILSPEKKEEHFGQFDHVRIYGLDYLERLKKQGFKVQVINISNKYKKFGLNKKEDLYITTK